MSEHAEHFESRVQEVYAQRLGMWVFLASEVLLFAALFTLYAAYRSEYGEEFARAIGHSNKLFGSLNTLVLITSSFSVALGVAAVELGKPRQALVPLLVTLGLAALFLVVKGFEYVEHYHAGAWPGRMPQAPTGRGEQIFYNLYFLMTGAHAVHVLIGMGVLSWLLVQVVRARLVTSSVALEIGALYWHLVDLVWIFLWPLFYLTGHTS